MISQQGKAISAGLFAGAFFGLFWIPLRAIEEAGIGPTWALFVIMALPALFALPFAWVQRHQYMQDPIRLIGGVICGIAFAFYAASFLYTEVVRAVLLFYTLPIWGFLIGRLAFGEVVTTARWIAIALGLIGLIVIFAKDTGLPLPSNKGDWFALIGAIIWSIGAALILLDSTERPTLHMTHFFVTAAILCLAVALAVGGDSFGALHEAFPSLAVWLAPVALLCIMPAGYATVYAPMRLNPGVVGLLFMLEVVVAAVAAAILAGEVLGPREWIGLPLILAAGLIEPLTLARRTRAAS